MILGGSKQGYRWLNLGIQVAQNWNIIQRPLRLVEGITTGQTLGLRDGYPFSTKITHYWKRASHKDSIRTGRYFRWETADSFDLEKRFSCKPSG
jgi:hypothetical protein